MRAGLRPAGGSLGTPMQVSPDGEIALWPDVAVTDEGDVLVGWIHNTSGGVEATVLK